MEEDTRELEKFVIDNAMFTPEQVADMLAVHRQSIYTWMRAGSIGYHKVGRMVRISRAQIEAYLVNRRVNPFPPRRKGNVKVTGVPEGIQ